MSSVKKYYNMPVDLISKSAGGEPTVADIFFLTTEAQSSQRVSSFLTPSGDADGLRRPRPSGSGNIYPHNKPQLQLR